jgi:hypothetical protein
MYKSLAVGVLLALGVSLSGCASAPASGTMAARDDFCSHIDCAQMAAINAIAHHNGVEVIWLDPPQKN